MADCDGGSFEEFSRLRLKSRRLDSFRATRLWQKFIREAMSNVRVGQQRHFLKNDDNVFNGEDLVDLVLHFLKDCTSELKVIQFERSNAITVCQTLLDNKLYESVVPKENSKFEDSSYRFYRFIEDNEVIPNINAEEKNRSNLEKEKENIFHSPAPAESSFLGFDVLNSNSIKRHQYRRSLRFKAPLMRVRETKPSPVKISKHNVHDTDQEVAVIELRDTALVILLHVIDIPLLQNALEVPPDLPELSEAPQPFVLENDFTPRKMKPLNHDFHGPVTDIPWIRAASQCLGGGHPPGLAGLWSVQACKILCYKAVSDRFSCASESIIPGEYFSICIAIVKLIKGNQRIKAIYASQLVLFHLPLKRRQQLQSLLNFLHIVVEDLSVTVDKKVTNYEAVLRDFLPVIFKHPLVSNETQKIIFDFLLLKSKYVFTIPSILWKIKDSGLVFCDKVSLELFEHSTNIYTRKSLVDLVTSVVDSTGINLADKKIWLKNLKKKLPDIYDLCKFTE